MFRSAQAAAGVQGSPWPEFSRMENTSGYHRPSSSRIVSRLQRHPPTRVVQYKMNLRTAAPPALSFPGLKAQA